MCGHSIQVWGAQSGFVWEGHQSCQEVPAGQSHQEALPGHPRQRWHGEHKCKIDPTLWGSKVTSCMQFTNHFMLKNLFSRVDVLAWIAQSAGFVQFIFTVKLLKSYFNTIFDIMLKSNCNMTCPAFHAHQHAACLQHGFDYFKCTYIVTLTPACVDHWSHLTAWYRMIPKCLGGTCLNQQAYQPAYRASETRVAFV